MIDRTFAARLRRVDPEALGAKLRAARVAAGLSQGEVAAGEVTISFISRIESGKRRADPGLIARIAERLEIDLDALLSEDITTDDPPVAHLIQFAEVAVEMGEPETALRHLDELPTEPGSLSQTSRTRAGVLRARALEAQGDLDGAIGVLEPLVDRAGEPVSRISLAIALSRCYRDAGELVRAIRVGESVLESLEGFGLLGGDEAVQLTVTVAAAYFEQGDRDYAVRLCRRALEAAEQFGSSEARASAYWNIGTMELERGDVPSAVIMVQRALALLSEGRDTRNIARLRSQLGRLELMLQPPAVEDAVKHLEAAEKELAASSAPMLDIQRNRLSLAHYQLVTDHPDRCREIALDVVETLEGRSPGVASTARALAGRAAAALGDTEQARADYLAAVQELTAIGSDRAAGQAWMDLGVLLESVGETEHALDAYRRAATSSGLSPHRTSQSHVIV